MKTSTWAVLVIFLALVGIFVYLDQKEPPADDIETTPAAPINYLFTATDGLPTSIEVENQSGQAVAIERNESGEWVLSEPVEVEADQASAEAAASQVSSLRILSELELDAGAVGLDPFTFAVTIEFTGGDEKTVRIGDLTPTGSGYYALIKGEDGNILVLSRDGIDSLLGLITSPPYLNTPMPDQSEGITPSVTPEK